MVLSCSSAMIRSCNTCVTTVDARSSVRVWPMARARAGSGSWRRMKELLAALCLVVVIEGLLLFVVPGVWKRAAEQLQALSEQRLRMTGGIILAVGLAALYLVRSQ